MGSVPPSEDSKANSPLPGSSGGGSSKGDRATEVKPASEPSADESSKMNVENETAVDEQEKEEKVEDDNKEEKREPGISDTKSMEKSEVSEGPERSEALSEGDASKIASEETVPKEPQEEKTTESIPAVEPRNETEREATVDPTNTKKRKQQRSVKDSSGTGGTSGAKKSRAHVPAKSSAGKKD